jgi:glycyl-tRNA synthetase
MWVDISTWIYFDLQLLDLLSSRREDELARTIKKNLQAAGVRAVYDDTGAIGKLYRRQDEIGTPFCITVDFQSLEDKTVTVRDRDTMGQERVGAGELGGALRAKVG